MLPTVLSTAGAREASVYVVYGPQGRRVSAVALIFFGSLAVLAIAMVGGFAAAENGRRWWIWAPLCIAVPLIPFIVAVYLPISRYLVSSIICALWSGYLARSKERRVWLWMALGFVFSYAALAIVAFMPRVGEPLLERGVAPPKGMNRDTWFRGEANRRRSERLAAERGRGERDRPHTESGLRSPGPF